MKIERIPLSSIDFNDLTYKIAPDRLSEKLLDSIGRTGVINPPALIEKHSKIKIITGRKRLHACIELGMTDVICTLYASDELSDEECLTLIFEDNRDRLTDMELSHLMLKHKERSDLSERDFIKAILTKLGIPPSRKHFERLSALANLDNEIKEAFFDEKITIEQASQLTGISEKDRSVVMKGIILKYRLNNNESRQVISDIKDIALREKLPLNDILTILESSVSSEKGVDKKGKSEFRKKVRSVRYPKLSETIAEFQRKIGELSLPKGVSISHHPYFESNELEINLKFDTADKLTDIIRTLESANGNDDIKSLLNLIKEGT